MAADPILNHPLVPAGPAELISTNDLLAPLLAHLREAGAFAYDSEFIGELTYLPKLCLLQVATTQRVALIDPLSTTIDLRPFWELLTDPAIEKVVHAGQQDVEPVIRHTGKEPANLFDTQIAAGFVGITYPVSLSKLVFECVGAKLGKGLTFTHWDQRPLSAMQLRYAADDVRYLPALRAELGRRLEAVGHAGYAREECDRMCDASLYRFDPETQYLRVRGAGSLQGHQLAVLKELVVWRDTAARAHDVPPRAFVRDEVLVDLSRSPAKTVEKLAKVKGLPRPVEAAHGTEIVEATLRALATPVTHQPAQRAADESPAEKFRADAIWAVAQCICLGQGIDPALATSRSDLAEFYRAAVADALPEDHALLQGWRKRLLADPLLEFMRSQSPLTLEWTNRSLQIRD